MTESAAAAPDIAPSEHAADTALAALTEDAVRPSPASIDRVVERIDDLTRVIARQAATIERLADKAELRLRDERAENDAPLVGDLFALHGLAQAFASTTQSDPDKQGFEAIARRVERMLVERGGKLVTPFRGTPFDPDVMEAAELTATDDPTADRTVESVIQPGLSIGDHSIRAAKVVVRRYRRV